VRRATLPLAAAALLATAGCAPRVEPTSPAAWRDAYRACQKGDQGACFWVGVSEEGARNHVEAAERYRVACEAGVAAACGGLAHLLAEGLGVERDLARSFALRQRACAGGSAQGCHLLGVALYRGIGVAPAPEKSTPLYEQACKGGYDQGCLDHARAVSEGRGVPKDPAFARATWRRLCPRLDVACDELADSLVDDPAQALAVAREGCREGGKWSCEKAGVLLRKAGQPEEAARYLRTACSWGAQRACAPPKAPAPGTAAATSTPSG
jgi:hypothetical protein